MFKKIELWIVGLIVIFFILLILLVSGVLRDAYLGKNQTPKFLRDNLLVISEFPVNVYNVIKHFSGNDLNVPPKLQKKQNKKRFKKFINKKRNALLVLPRYDHSKSRSIVNVIDLNDFRIIHTYEHDNEMLNKVENNEEFPD